MIIRINKCTDPMAWYASRVGQFLEVEWTEKNNRPEQGIPENVYWCREGGTYNPINYVRQSDATEIRVVTSKPPEPSASDREPVSELTPSVSRVEQAKRHALHEFDSWNDVTGFVEPHSGYYNEITSIIEDAVEYGFGVAHGQTFQAIRERIKKA